MLRRLINFVTALLSLAAVAFVTLWACSGLGAVVFEMNANLRTRQVALDHGELFLRLDEYRPLPPHAGPREPLPMNPSFFLDIGLTDWQPERRVGPRGTLRPRFRFVAPSPAVAPTIAGAEVDVTVRILPAWFVAAILWLLPATRGVVWAVARWRRRGEPRPAPAPGRWGRRFAVASAVVMLLACGAWGASGRYRSQWTAQTDGFKLFLGNRLGSAVEFHAAAPPPGEAGRARASVAGYVFGYAATGGGPTPAEAPPVLSVGGVYYVGSWDALDLLQRDPKHRDDRFVSGEDWEGLPPPPSRLAPAGPGTQLVGTVIVLRYWLIVLVTALWPAVWTWRWLKRKRFGPGTCKTCGYDLRGTPERCPECGTPAAT